MNFGISTLGGYNYPSEIIAGVTPGYRVKFFLKWGSKDALGAIEKVAASGKFPYIGIHLAAFDYKHLYPINSLMKGLIADAKRVAQLQKKYPHIDFGLNAFCEQNHTQREMTPVYEQIHKAAPECSLFNAIWKGEEITGILTEIHLANARPVRKPKGPYGVDFDGFGGDGTGNMSDANVDAIIAAHPQAKYIDGWFFQANGKFGWKDGRDIAHRDDYAYRLLLAGHCALFVPREGGLTWPENMLWKPFADDHDEADSIPGNKDNRAMAILPWAGDAEVLDSRNNVISKMKRAATDYNVGTLKGPRYYSDKYAVQLGAIAQKNTGSKLISVRVGGKKTPLTDATKRSGRF